MARKKVAKKTFWQNLGSGIMSGLEAVSVALEEDRKEREEEIASQVAVRSAGTRARTNALIITYINEVMSGSRYRRDDRLQDIAEWCDRAGYTEAGKVARLGMSEKPTFNFGVSDPEVIRRLMTCLSQGMA